MALTAPLMKAAVCRRYGPPNVVEIAEVPTPRVGANDVLVKVRATTVTAGDWRLRSGNIPRGFGFILRLGFGFSGPRQPILGSELAGEVMAVGPSVSRFKPGDQVFAARIGKCHAEYAAVRANAVAPMPANLSFGQAAALTFGGLTALTFLRDKARIRAGERVLVNGASGAVGSAAVQLAKHFKAVVTGVCSAANAQLVRSLGADHVIDYATEDFTRSRERYDIVFDAVGNCSFDRCKPVLAPGGRLLLVVAIWASWSARWSGPPERAARSLAESPACAPGISCSWGRSQSPVRSNRSSTGRTPSHASRMHTPTLTQGGSAATS